MRVNTMAAGVLAAAGFAVLAGPLDPPPGPISATMKPLDQVEPRVPITAETTPGDSGSIFKITKPGSYYLTGNIAGTPGKSGIHITASNVSVDLRGFTISGGAVGIFAEQVGEFLPIRSINLRDGIVAGSASTGIAMGDVFGGRIQGVHVSDCGGPGISSGEGALVQDCTSRVNQVGAMLADGSVMANCTVQDNTDGGVAAMRSFVRACAIQDNGGFGLEGNGATFENCYVYSNHIGVIANGCVVRDCQVIFNDTDGIEARFSSMIEGNDCSSNGMNAQGAGVRLKGDGNRVQDNSLIYNRYGLLAEGTNNFIARNTARGNGGGNFSIGPGNDRAPIVTNPGANDFATATPWSNFAY